MASTADSADHSAACLNCATPLAGHHCHGCGQPAHVHRSVRGIGHDLMHGVLHLDGKLAATLPLLALKPGQLTRRYVAGERRRFVSPMGMFLFSVTVLFLVIQVLGVQLFELGDEELVGPTLARAEQSLEGVDDPRPGNHTHSGSFIQGAMDGLAEDEENGSGVEVAPEADSTVAVVSPTAERKADFSALGGAIRSGSDETEKRSQAERARVALPLIRQARAAWSGPSSEQGDQTTGNATMDAAVKKAIKDPALVAYKVQANSYKFSWALIPLSVPFVWLLFFWRRDLGLYDHTVFVTYSIAAMTLLTVLLLLLSKFGVPEGLLVLSLFLLAPLHIFVHLRASYGLSKRATLLRFLLLSVFIWLAVGLFAAILIALGALG